MVTSPAEENGSMATADAPSFWSQPVAVTRAYFARMSTPQAVEWTLHGTMAVTMPYFFWRDDLFAMQAYTGLYLVASNLAVRQRRRLERPDESARGTWMAVMLGAAVVAFAFLQAWTAGR